MKNFTLLSSLKKLSITISIFLSIPGCNSGFEKHNFSGKLLVTSDADMIATAYANGVLNKVKGIEDSLTLIRFETGKPELSQIHVSNSVMSWPAIMAYSSKNKIAYIAETKGIFVKDTNAVGNVWQDMPVGKSISLVDVSDPSNLNFVQKEVVGENIFSVSLNYENNILAAGSTVKGKELIICPLEDGRISSKFYFSDSLIQDNVGIPSLNFHPTKNILAVNINNTHVAFYHIIQKNDKTFTTERIGDALEVSIKWSEGKWLNNGNFFIICDYALDNPFTNQEGSLKTVSFDLNGNHTIISEVKTGLSTEGFDISFDNKYAVAVNMGRSYFPNTVPDSIRVSPSLTLIKLDAEKGYLSRLGDNYSFHGALPEDASFDLDGNTIAVVIYHKLDEEFPHKGLIEFWEIENDSLKQLPESIHLTRGPHTITTIK